MGFGESVNLNFINVLYKELSKFFKFYQNLLCFPFEFSLNGSLFLLVVVEKSIQGIKLSSNLKKSIALK